jgi:deoxyribonuclease-4
MVRAADRAREIGATTIQIFSDNPTAWHRRTTTPRELDAFRARLAEHDIRPLATHASYLINLAGPDPEFWARSVDVLAAELGMARAYGAALVNVHAGSHRGTGFEAGRARLAEGIARAIAVAAAALVEGSSSPELPAPDFPSPEPVVVIENSAGSGDAVGSSLEELAAILDAAEQKGVPRERLGVCLDTAHLWAAGVELSEPDAIDRLLAVADARLGPGRLAMIHLNDSKSALGSRLDRHEHIGAGRIGEAGLRHLVIHPRLADVPLYLETPDMDEGYDLINMERVRMLIAGQALPALPPDAFERHSPRAQVAAAVD